MDRDGVLRDDSNEVLQLACDARVKVPSDPWMEWTVQSEVKED